jgi:hypothetical protein
MGNFNTNRTVGAKVARAALIRERVKGGCIVCGKRRREEVIV